RRSCRFAVQMMVRLRRSEARVSGPRVPRLRVLPSSDASCGLPCVYSVDSLMGTCRFIALLLDVLQKRFDFIVFESEIGHAGVVEFREEGFGGRVGVEHRRGIADPAAQPCQAAALREPRQVGPRTLSLPDRMAPDTAAVLEQ